MRALPSSRGESMSELPPRTKPAIAAGPVPIQGKGGKAPRLKKCAAPRTFRPDFGAGRKRRVPVGASGGQVFLRVWAPPTFGTSRKSESWGLHERRRLSTAPHSQILSCAYGLHLRGIGQNLRRRGPPSRAPSQPCGPRGALVPSDRSIVSPAWWESGKAGGRAMSNLYQRGKKTYWGSDPAVRDASYRRRASRQRIEQMGLNARLLPRSGSKKLEAIGHGGRQTAAVRGKRRLPGFIARALPPRLKLSAQLRYAVSMKHLNNHFAGKMLHQITSAQMSEFETKRRADRRLDVDHPGAILRMPGRRL